MSFRPPRDTWALVTGASSGIGAALAEAIAARGMPLVVTARSEERLGALADAVAKRDRVPVVPIAIDLAHPDAPSVLIAATEGAGRPLGLLVNDAGFGWNGPFDAQPLDETLAMLRLNVLASTELAHRALGAMRARKGGGILNVSSTAAFLPGPYFAAYSATKAYLLSLSMALHEEARRDGVTVTALCPGFTKTRFADAARMKGGEATLFPVMTPEAVAAAGLRALDRGRSFAVTHPLDRLWIAAGRLIPRTLPPRFAARFFTASQRGPR